MVTLIRWIQGLNNVFRTVHNSFCTMSVIAVISTSMYLQAVHVLAYYEHDTNWYTMLRWCTTKLISITWDYTSYKRYYIMKNILPNLNIFNNEDIDRPFINKDCLHIETIPYNSKDNHDVNDTHSMTSRHTRVCT